MKAFSVTWYEKLRKLDYIVLAAVLVLTLVSLITLAGAANDIGTKYFYVQLGAAALGFVAMAVISTIDYEEVADRFSVFLFVIGVLMLGVTLLIGTGDGNKSWIRFSWLPIGIQPSEFVKVLYIVSFSKHISLVRDKINHPLSLVKLGAHAGIIIGLIMLQGDLGSALVFMFMTAAMLYCAGLSFWYFLAAAGIIVAAAPFLWEHLADYHRWLPSRERPYRQGLSGAHEPQCHCCGRLFRHRLFGRHRVSEGALCAHRLYFCHHQ